MSSRHPATAAGRAIWDEKPIGWRGQDWRDAVLAIEAEAAAREPALDVEALAWAARANRAWAETVARDYLARLAEPEEKP